MNDLVLAIDLLIVVAKQLPISREKEPPRQLGSRSASISHWVFIQSLNSTGNLKKKRFSVATGRVVVPWLRFAFSCQRYWVQVTFSAALSVKAVPLPKDDILINDLKMICIYQDICNTTQRFTQVLRTVILLHSGIDTEINEMVLPALGKGPTHLVKSIIFQWCVWIK